MHLHERMSRLCFLTVGLIAISVLLSWSIGSWSLTLPGRVNRPMALSTAWLLLGLALAAYRRHVVPAGHASHWLASTIGFAVVVSGVWVLVRASTPDAASFPIGVMTPAAAVVLIVAGAAIGLPPGIWTSRSRLQVEATSGLLVAFSGAGILLGHWMDVRTAAGQPMPAASTGLAFLILGAGIALGRGPHAWPDFVLLPSPSDVERRTHPRTLLTAFGVGVAVCVSLIGTFIWVNAAAKHRAARHLVSAAAEDHAQQLTSWFTEREIDAKALAGNPLIRDEFLKGLDVEGPIDVRGDIVTWMDSLVLHSELLSATLLDSRARIRAQVPPQSGFGVGAPLLESARAAMRTGRVQFVDLSPAADGQSPWLSWVVPLGAPVPRAAVIMTANPAPHIQPKMLNWFSRNSSAEAVLVRREGNDVVFLSVDSRRAGSPGRLAIAAESEMPSARAANGEFGEVYAKDYRGVPVIASMRPVVGTPWSLVVKIDEHEINAGIWTDSWLITMMIGGAVIILLLTGVSLWLRREEGVSRHVGDLQARERSSAEQLRRLRDAREQVRAEAAVQTLRTAIAQIPMSVLITDLAGDISYVNPTFTAVTGYAAAEVVGHNVRMLKSGTHDAVFYRWLWDTVLSTGAWTGDIQNRRKNGELFWETATISQLRDEEARPFGYVAIKRDITIERQSASELEQVRAQFAQAQKMESVGRLAGGVAHDFNNMLAVIVGHAEIALDGLPEQDPKREHLDEILAAGQRSADLTRQLLAFARKQAVHPKVIDLNQSIGDMLKMLRRLIGEHIDLGWHPGAALWPIHIDPAQVDQILANLSVNARDAIGVKGTVTITTANVDVTADMLRRLPRGRVGQFVELAIADSGCGMTPDVLAHLFEPFFTTKEAGKGTGLGTATVYGIVSQNQGFIHVDSAVGAGTIMRVFLPRTFERPDAPHADAETTLPGGTETVLLVEDEPAMLDTCRRMLAHLGYTVLACGSAADARNTIAANQGQVDLLLTDVVMPTTSGRELAATIQKADPRLRVLFMSGYTAEVFDGSPVVAGDHACLSKPFSTAQLAISVREALA